MVALNSAALTCPTASKTTIAMIVTTILFFIFPPSLLIGYLITPGELPEACFEFVIPSKEGIHAGFLDARFHGHDILA
jgi:hypothetical protein